MQKTENLICYLLIAIFAAVLFYVEQHPSYIPPQGIVLGLAPAEPAITASEVKVYTLANAMSPGKLLAVINVEGYAGIGDPGEAASVQAMVDYAKSLAASVGANELMTTGEGYDPSMNVNILQLKAYVTR